MPYVKAGSFPTGSESEPRAEQTLPPASSNLLQSSFAYISNQSFIATASAMDTDPEDDGGVKLYTVEEGDTISAIAAKFGITPNTILWSNNIDDIDSIMPGDQLFILPVAGLKYIVQNDDTIETIATKYKAEKDKILAFNDLPANGKLESGQEIIIPGGQKELPPPVRDNSGSLLDKRQYSTPTSGKYVEINHGRGNHFPYGWCTWYVAQKRYVPWHGNAGAWLYNAKSMGYATGKSPKAGSIVVTTEHRVYGHVALVESVGNGTITVSEMNYKGWGIKNKRTLSTSSRAIKGYIY